MLLPITKKIVKKIIICVSKPFGFLFDLYVTPRQCPKTTLYKRIKRTRRYRFASKGKPLTENEEKLLKYQNKYNDERCFIIGNGPSLNAIDLKLLKNEITFGVNAIYTNYEKMGFYPTFHIVEDIFVAEDRADEINNYKGSTKIYGNYLKYCLNDENTLWLNVIFRYDNYKNFPNFSTNAIRRVWTGGTVSYISMQLAYYMGFKEVYLIGFDHSYKVPNNFEINGNDILSTGDDPNHFNKDYFGKGKRWHDPMVDRMEISYKKAKCYFENNNRKIYNATVGGQLEVFDRVDFKSLF